MTSVLVRRLILELRTRVGRIELQSRSYGEIDQAEIGAIEALITRISTITIYGEAKPV